MPDDQHRPTDMLTPVVDMGEFEPYASIRRVTAAESAGNSVTVQWDDGRSATFHRLWLRDNCACATCRHPQTHERVFKLLDADDPGVPEISATPQGALRCVWADGHESLFDPGWLLRYVPGAETAAPTLVPEARTWEAADMAGGLAQASFAEVMESEAGLARWLDALVRDGAALLVDGPAEDGALSRVAERVGWARETNFGRQFEVVSKPNPNNAAYTAIGLEPHIDLPNWRRPPDFQLLYCIENGAEGGDSLLVDGFRVAQALKGEDPEAYETLSTQPVDFRFQDESGDIRFRAPTIQHDADGRISEIRFNNWIRDAQTLAPEVAESFYRGYRRFWELLRDPRFAYAFRLEPGQMMAFDNLRVLHGRGAFDPSTGRRHLQGCYLDRDLVESRLRIAARA